MSEEQDLFRNFHLMRQTAAPIMVSFDVTSRCNLRCVHCFNDSGADAPFTDLAPAQKLDIARQIASLRPHNVCLCGGETLCCPNLMEIIDVLRPAVGKLSMVSNGYLMTRELAEALHDGGLSLVQISIDGANAWQHDSFRGVQGSFDRAVAAVRHLVAAGVPMVDVSLVPNRLNYRSLGEYLRMCCDLGVHQVRMMPFLPSGRGKSIGRNMMLSAQQYFELGRTIRHWNRDRTGLPDIQWGDPLDHMRRMPTNAEAGLHTYVMEIKTNGDLSVTTYLPLVAGNCTRHTLREYWDGGYNLIWADKRFTEYTDRIRDVYDLEDFEPAPYSGETVTFDILEGEPCNF